MTIGEVPARPVHRLWFIHVYYYCSSLWSMVARFDIMRYWLKHRHSSAIGPRGSTHEVWISKAPHARGWTGAGAAGAAGASSVPGTFHSQFLPGFDNDIDGWNGMNIGMLGKKKTKICQYSNCRVSVVVVQKACRNEEWSLIIWWIQWTCCELKGEPENHSSIWLTVQVYKRMRTFRGRPSMHSILWIC